MAGKKRADGGMSKREAVRRALADLGPDATPTQLQPHIREKYGIDMTTDHISTEKGNLRKKAGAAKRGATKTLASKPPAQASVARQSEPEKPAAQAKAAGGDAIGLDDIEAVKGLVERVGAANLKKLIEVMAR
jgi:hypothetical protein